jgi:hypothetical protein
MGNHPFLNRSFLLPVGVSILSTVGICLLLVIAYWNKPQTPALTEEPATPFKYILLATETPILSPTAENDTSLAFQIESTSTSTLRPDINNKVIPTQTAFVLPSHTATKIINPVSTAIPTTAIPPSQTPGITVTPTLDETLLFTAGKYDDGDSRIEYDGDWVNELFINGSYEQTLYVSPTTGNTATFSFTGRQLKLGYFSDPELGTVSITIDNVEYFLNQANGSEWSSPQLSPGVHSVFIIHKTGDLVFVDYITIV